MRISAVICTFRQPETLRAAIESLTAQSLSPNLYEIIVVDNNSQDETVKIVQDYIQKYDSRIKYVLERRQGLSYARNAGVNLASGDIIAFLDDDAVADPDWLTALLEVYDSVRDAWAVGGKVLPLWDGERPKWLEDTMLRSLSIVEWGNKRRPLKWPERIIGTNCSFRNLVFSEIGLFDTNLGRRATLLLGNEDTEIQERIHNLGKLVFYTPEAVVYHHIRCERMTKKYFYRRAYGTGRSEAILGARQGSCYAVLRRALKICFLLPKQYLCLMLTIIMRRRDRFHRLQGIAYNFGIVYQTICLLLLRKDCESETVR